MTDELLPQLHALEARVAALEHRDAHPSRAEVSTLPTPAAYPTDDTFWALDGLAARTGRPHEGSGAVMIVGDIVTPGGTEARWQYGLSTESLLEVDWSALAPALAALGHPVRLAVLRAVLDGAGTTREIADAVGVTSTGQLYHHLTQLQAAGWLRSHHGGAHVVPTERLVPLLTTILGALR